MSHNTTIGQIIFADVGALRAAADELQQRGINCDLIENAIPRAYSQNQLPRADLVLRLNAGRFDVGFYKEGEDDHYTAKADLWGGHVADQIGTPREEGISQAEADLGQLRHAYAAHATMNQVVRQGGTVQRIDNEDGSTQLVVQNLAA